MERGMFDYVIVGAGSAGCVLANRLSADPAVSVLVIEAGPEPTDPWIKIPAGMSKLYLPGPRNWGYLSQPEPHLDNRVIYWPRGKVLGGTSAINGMLYIRGNRQDYDAWSAAGNRGWGWDDLLPLFKRGEAFQGGESAAHGATGELVVSDPIGRLPFSTAFIEAAVAAGHPLQPDFNTGAQDGVGFAHFTIRRGQRHSSYEAYLKPVRHRRNLTVLTGTLVEKILLSDGRASGVQYRRAGQPGLAEARREVILAGGVINSPQLLMLSGIGPGAHLREHGVETQLDLPGVGQNLHDHLYANLVLEVGRDSSINRRLRGIMAYVEGLKYVFGRTGHLTNGASQTTLFARTRYSPDQPDIQINSRPNSFSFRQGSIAIDEFAAVTVSICQLRPRSRGELRLASPDPAAPPTILANYLKEEMDRLTMIAGVRMAQRIVETRPVAARIKGYRAPESALESDDDLLAYIRATAQSVYHPVGTCRMGGDAMAVVDDRLKVRGMRGLRVADASIMPSIISGNTNAPTMVIGEKAADMIREDNR